MKLPDTNVLLAAINEDASGHHVAREWLAASLSDARPTGFAWLALIGFVRIATKAGVFPHPLPVDKTLDLVDEWIGQPNATVLHPGDRHPAILRELLNRAGAGGNLTSDAHLAAIAIEHGATLATFDSDFHRFEDLRLEFLRA